MISRMPQNICTYFDTVYPNPKLPHQKNLDPTKQPTEESMKKADTISMVILYCWYDVSASEPMGSIIHKEKQFRLINNEELVSKKATLSRSQNPTSTSTSSNSIPDTSTSFSSSCCHAPCVKISLFLKQQRTGTQTVTRKLQAQAMPNTHAPFSKITSHIHPSHQDHQWPTHKTPTHTPPPTPHASTHNTQHIMSAPAPPAPTKSAPRVRLRGTVKMRMRKSKMKQPKSRLKDLEKQFQLKSGEQFMNMYESSTNAIDHFSRVQVKLFMQCLLCSIQVVIWGRRERNTMGDRPQIIKSKYSYPSTLANSGPEKI